MNFHPLLAGITGGQTGQQVLEPLAHSQQGLLQTPLPQIVDHPLSPLLAQLLIQPEIARGGSMSDRLHSHGFRIQVRKFPRQLLQGLLAGGAQLGRAILELDCLR